MEITVPYINFCLIEILLCPDTPAIPVSESTVFEVLDFDKLISHVLNFTKLGTVRVSLG